MSPLVSIIDNTPQFDMYQYRQILVRMRWGDSDRDIARSKTMGRKKIAHGWLVPDSAMPDE